MKLEQLMEGVPFTLVQGSLDTEIADIIYDSRKAAPGLLFVCIVGTQRDSHAFAADCAAGKRMPEELDDGLFSSYLDSRGIPDPELIIRPSGELRLSNFLLWQCAYSEFYYTDTLWPDFDEAELDRAILSYQNRDRRFGGVKAGK